MSNTASKAKEKTKMKDVVKLTVVIDPNGNECLYVNGCVWESVGEISVYTCDLVAAAGDCLIDLKHVSCAEVDDWPEKLHDLAECC